MLFDVLRSDHVDAGAAYVADHHVPDVYGGDDHGLADLAEGVEDQGLADGGLDRGTWVPSTPTGAVTMRVGSVISVWA